MIQKGAMDIASSNIKVVFRYSIDSVWNMVTAVENYAWRSDLSKIEIINKNQFIEYTKEGYATTFTITMTEPFKRWQFDMYNYNMKGHWTGLFMAKGEEETEISFTEDVIVKKIIMKPFIKTFLKKQQRLYISDLLKELKRVYG